ncbi:MAG: PKD domain-containing protein [Pseudomonadota bacterium]
MRRATRLVPVLAWVFACFLVAGCKDSDLEAEAQSTTGNAQSSSSDKAFFDADGAATQLIDATENEVWVYVDLDRFAVVTPTDALSDDSWDVAFQRFKVKVNGGVSGSGGVTVAAVKDTALLQAEPGAAGVGVADRSLDVLSDEELLQLGDNLFFSVCAPGFDDADSDSYCLANNQVNRSRLSLETAAFAFLTLGSGEVIGGTSEEPSAILGWYDYFPSENHLLRPSGDTWMVTSTEGISFALEMLGYYGLVEGDAEPGNIAFRYVSMTPEFTIPQPGAQQLTASLAASATDGVAPLSVDFTADVSGVSGEVTFSWDFGDGASASGDTTAHTFDTPGVYDVTLRVTDSRGAAAAVQRSTRVIVREPDPGPPPVANAGEDLTIDLDTRGGQATVTLDGGGSSDADNNIVSYVWTGSPDPNDEVSPQVVVGAGQFVFTLMVTDASGQSDTDSVTVTINDPANQTPMAVATASATTGIAPLEVTFSSGESADPDGTLVSIEWNFGDGSPGVFDADAIHTFERPGRYVARLTVMDADGALANDEIVISVGAVHHATQDTYVYEFLGNQSGFEDDGVTLSGDSGGLSVWNHENVHGGKAVVGFADAVADDAAIAAATGGITATLWLYSVCEQGGFVSSCPGLNPDTDNPNTPDVSTVKTDVFLQTTPWLENDASLSWSMVHQDGTPFATLVQSTAGQWFSVDITALVAEWIANNSVGAGLALSQENYPVIRDDTGFIPVAAFCDSESSDPACRASDLGFDPRPYIEITMNP